MDIVTFTACILGLALDLIFGDPRKMPHLVKLAGNLINQLETFWVKRLERTVFSGTLLWLSLMLIMLGGYLLLRGLLSSIHPWLSLPLDAIVVFQSVAFTDLTKHVAAIADALTVSIEKARERGSSVAIPVVWMKTRSVALQSRVAPKITTTVRSPHSSGY